MSRTTAINLHIERVVIDEAVHRAGPDAVRAAVEAQLPALLAAGGVRDYVLPSASAIAGGIAARIPTSIPARKS
jgi:hypothetical protein